jgi:ABC-2 type transport system permease protein
MNRSQRLLQVMRLHQRSFWRNPESAFFNFAMPLAVLLIYGATVSNNPLPGAHGVRVLTLFVPGILAFAVVVIAYGNLAATVALQRTDGVLKRLRATPMQPSLYIGGQLVSVLTITLLVALATIGLGAVAFGALPVARSLPQLLLVVGLGIACFAALGMAISTVIPTADAANPITNGTYLPLAMVSGMFSPTLHLPKAIASVIGALPFKALTDGLRATYDPGAGGTHLHDLTVLAVWTAVGVLLAKRFFRWDP